MTPARARRAVYLQSTLSAYRQLYPENTRLIAATEDLLFLEEQALAAEGSFVTPDGELVSIPREAFA